MKSLRDFIAKICAKHGSELLPRLFAEIDRTLYDRRNIETVFRAYAKLTHEDLRAFFPNR